MMEDAPSVGSFLKKNSMVQAIRPFLGREREFLQSMARLIQEHADSVREEVRQIREEPPGIPDDAGAQVDAGVHVEAGPTALPGKIAPRSAPRSHSGTTTDAEIPKRSGKRSAERQPSPPEGISSHERAKTPEHRGRDAEDGRRVKGRQAPGSPGAPSTRPERRSGDPIPGNASEGSPADLFQPKRRVARPPVSRLEQDQSGRSVDEGPTRKDLPATQPFEPLRFDERSPGGDQPLERGDGDEDERSLRELFWGEE